MFFKVRVANQLRMVHLDHLQLLGRCKFLLDQIVALAAVCLLYLIYLAHESLLIVSCLLRTHFFSLIREL